MQKVKGGKMNLKKGVYLVDGDVNKMPFKDNFFNKIIMSRGWLSIYQTT